MAANAMNLFHELALVPIGADWIPVSAVGHGSARRIDGLVDGVGLQQERFGASASARFFTVLAELLQEILW